MNRLIQSLIGKTQTVKLINWGVALPETLSHSHIFLNLRRNI